MGLTIHHSQQTEGELGIRDVSRLLEQVRQRAMDLPFHKVDDKLFDLSGDECDIAKMTPEQRKGLDDCISWVLTGVYGSYEIARREYQLGPNSKSVSIQSIDYPPKRVLGFSVLVAPGCEPLNFWLAQYPKTVRYELKAFPWRNRTYRTGKVGWSGRGFCKTQYASDPECGGLQNFLRAHISVITLLEFAQSLPGLKVEINDEGRYGTSYYTDDWKVPEPVYTWHPATHDVALLAKESESWDQFIAAGAGAFKDAVQAAGGDPSQLISAIDSRPDREHLEAKGVEAMPEIRTNLGLEA